MIELPRLTPPQARALQRIVDPSTGPFEDGALAVHRLGSRMVDSMRIAQSLLRLGLVEQKNDYLYVTDLGRRALEAYNFWATGTAAGVSHVGS